MSDQKRERRRGEGEGGRVVKVMVRKGRGESADGFNLLRFLISKRERDEN